MIVLDTSALTCVVFDEMLAPRCQAVLLGAEDSMISSVTLAEALIVSARRGRSHRMARLIDLVSPAIVPVEEASARAAAQAYDRWGKGVHPARLNFADCFAYVLARSRDCPLLYVGEDFAQTDVASALADPA